MFGVLNTRIQNDNKQKTLFRPRKVVAFGNVLLDQTAHLPDTQLLERYKLSLNTRAELDVETLAKVTTEAISDNK